MKKTSITAIFFFLTLILSGAAARAEEKELRKVLFYTYVGPVIGFGYNHIKYKEWNQATSLYGTEYVSGPHFNGGCALNLHAENFIGDFRIEYMYNLNDGNHVITHFFYSIFGKYRWPINEMFGITSGLGIYFETPPSNTQYNGCAGLQVPVGVIVKTSFDTRLFADFVTRFGYYGYDDNNAKIKLSDSSYKVSYGLQIGFLFKVGRL